MEPMHVIALDDDEVQLEWLRVFFDEMESPPCRLTVTADSGQLFEILERDPADVVISDFHLPHTSGMAVTERVKEINPQIEVIIITVGTELTKAVETLKYGAFDFLVKPLDPAALTLCLSRIYEKKEIFSEENKLERSLDNPVALKDIIFESAAMQRVIYMASRCADSDINVLIRGESGTGKEVIAYLIHYASARKNHPFVVVNMAALPDGLIESELFGHTKGAFTGATAARKGRFEEADGGSLFIDEIGDCSPALQAKILRALQFKTYQKVGSNEENHSDVRIIAATNRDLETMIDQNQFREDLYYRLNVVSLRIPPLRERREDIDPLCRYFIERTNRRQNKQCRGFTREAMDRIYRYDFPGNIRELENMIEHAVLFMSGDHITLEDLPPTIRQADDGGILPQAPEIRGNYQNLMEDFESRLLERALRENGGNQSAAARQLGISERKLRSRLERLGMKSGRDAEGHGRGHGRGHDSRHGSGQTGSDRD